MKDRTLSGYTVGMIGREGILYLGATTRADETARSQAEVDALFDSFRWDEGYAWEPPPGGSLLGVSRADLLHLRLLQRPGTKRVVSTLT